MEQAEPYSLDLDTFDGSSEVVQRIRRILVRRDADKQVWHADRRI